MPNSPPTVNASAAMLAVFHKAQTTDYTDNTDKEEIRVNYTIRRQYKSSLSLPFISVLSV